jgi:hypothetical protein
MMSFKLPPALWQDVQDCIPRGERSKLVQDCLGRAVARRRRSGPLQGEAQRQGLTDGRE